jgi:serine protease Do
VSSTGYILTNCHVVLGADTVTVKLADGATYKAQTVGTDAHTEIAVLKIDAAGLQVAELGDSSSVTVGQWVLAMGSPFGLDQTVTAGIISAKGRTNLGIAGDEDFLQTDAAINPGSSGGPLVSLDGKVIGINTAIASGSGGSVGIGFAIPIDMARSVMEIIIRDGRVQRGWLGIAVQDLDEDLARSFGFSGTNGVLIGDVAPGGPATRAGLRPGDIITRVDGTPAKSLQQFRSQIADTLPGTEVQIEFFRDGNHTTLSVPLDEHPTQVEAAKDSKRPNAQESTAPADWGLRVSPLSPELAKQLGHDSPEAIAVISVEPGSPAGKAGVRSKDVIVSIAGQAVRTVEEFQEAVQLQDIQNGVLLQVRSNGLRRFVLIKAE